MKIKSLSMRIALFSGVLLAIISVRVISFSPTQNYMPIVYKSIPITFTPTSTSTSTSTPTSTSTSTSTSTPTQTSTFTSTPTSTSTSTSTPTATPFASGVWVLPNYTWRIGSGYLFIYGEVWNNTVDYVDFINIAVNYFDASGQLVDTHNTYTFLDNALAAGDKTFFYLYLLMPPNYSYFEFEDPTYFIGGQPAPNLTIVSHSGTWDPIMSRYYLTGLVRNDDDDIVDLPKVIITIYNSNGLVVGGGYDYLDKTSLYPGDTGYFQATFSGSSYPDVTYRLQADGWEQP